MSVSDITEIQDISQTFKVILVPATFHTYQRDLETLEVEEELQRISVLSYPDIQCNLDLSQCLSDTADTEL